jgi:uncharacterized protein YjbI with pentapeptide repeats
MNDSERDRSTIIEVLGAFIRQRLDGSASEIELVQERAKYRAAEEEEGHPFDPDEPPIPLIPLAEDIRAALSVLSRNRRKGQPHTDLRTVKLHHWDAREAEMIGVYAPKIDLSFAALVGADFTGSDLGEAVLFDTKLNNANLSHVDLYDADMRDCKLQKAELVGAALYDSVLDRADAREAKFQGADLSHTEFRGAKLQGADFRSANLTEARLNRARLAGADLATAQGVTVEQVCRAYIRETTKLPPDIASHPWVQARIADCERAAAQGQDPPDWQEPSAGAKGS